MLDQGLVTPAASLTRAEISLPEDAQGDAPHSVALYLDQQWIKRGIY